jgi:hypothetical protein
MTRSNQRNSRTAPVEWHRGLRQTLFAIATLMALLPAANAGTREVAKAIHDRLTGVPATAGDLDQMAGMSPVDAALFAINSGENRRYFATVTLKNFAAPWTNRDQSVFVPLNDYTTLVIGTVINDDRFDQILTADRLYVETGAPPPVASNNAHYAALEARMLEPDFDPLADLSPLPQSSAYPMLPPAATAGVMTTRAASESFFIAGTNRAMFRFTLLNHMCMDLEQVHDTSIVPDRIRQDVSRSPGADSRVFLNNCVGCHAGMDPLAQAYAYYNFDEGTDSIEYTAGSVQAKYFNNAETFADGYVTPDDSWVNYWRGGQNSLLGWNPALPGSGSGAKALGAEIAGTAAFAECQVTKVFRAMCLRDPADDDDREQVRLMTQSFVADFRLKQVFAESAAYCTRDF